MGQARTEMLTAAAVMLVGLVFLILALQIKTAGIRTPAEALVGPAMIPISVSVLIIALGALNLAVHLLQSLATAVGDKSEANTLEGAATTGENRLLRTGSIIALGFFYVWLFSATGYAIATATILALMLFVFGSRRPVEIIGLTVVGTAVYYFVFIRLMGVYDPPGWLISLK